MALSAIPGGKFRVTIKKTITRESAYKTLARLFASDPVIRGPIEKRATKHQDKPKRRGGRIWTKRPNKVHIELPAGTSATIKATAQYARDLNSVSDFVDVAKV